MKTKNYYNILGVEATASQDEIKSAYRKLSLKFHPDKNNGDTFLEEMFKNINEANEVLSNTSKRKSYDNSFLEVEEKPTKQYYGSSLTEIDIVVTNLKKYFDNDEIAFKKFIHLKNEESIPKPKYFTIPKFLLTIVFILVLWVFFRPTTTMYDNSNDEYEWVTKQEANIYKKPDFNSEILGNFAPNTGFNSLRETKYFVKTEFLEDNGETKQGYILKDNLTHKKASP